MSKKKIKCILFDADGVVIERERFSKQYSRKHGISNEEMLPFFKGIHRECIAGKVDLKLALKEWLPKWKWKGTTDNFLQYWFESENKLNERVIKTVEGLKAEGIKCFIATNHEKYRVTHMKEVMGFDGIFDGIFFAGNIGFKKPEKEFYEYILKNLKDKHGFNPAEIMFFDDEQKNVDGAKKLGIDAYFYKSFKDFERIVK
jgi:putative hydrolase of the HAD superfamily